jgi:hypothetical protein
MRHEKGGLWISSKITLARICHNFMLRDDDTHTHKDATSERDRRQAKVISEAWNARQRSRRADSKPSELSFLALTDNRR